MGTVIPMKPSAVEKLTGQIKEVAGTATEADKTMVATIVERAKLGIRSAGLFVLSPAACALLFLYHNTHNRALSPGWVRELLRRRNHDMWKFTNSAVGFYVDGAICDAQHRLASAALSELNFETVIVFGVDKGSVDVIDDGRRRSAASTAFLEGGIQNAAVKQTIVKASATYWWNFAGDETYRVPSNSEVVAEMRANDDTLRTAIEIGTDAESEVTAKLISKSTASTLAYLLLKGEHPEDFVRSEVTAALGGSDKYTTTIQFLVKQTKKAKTLRQIKEIGALIASIIEVSKGNWVTMNFLSKAIEGKRLPDPRRQLQEAAE